MDSEYGMKCAGMTADVSAAYLCNRNQSDQYIRQPSSKTRWFLKKVRAYRIQPKIIWRHWSPLTIWKALRKVFVMVFDYKAVNSEKTSVSKKVFFTTPHRKLFRHQNFKISIIFQFVSRFSNERTANYVIFLKVSDCMRKFLSWYCNMLWEKLG